MRKASWIAVRMGVGAGLALVLAAVLCIEGIDYRPYFTTAYYRETLASLSTQQARATAARGELSAGFGRARLTPTLEVAQEQAEQGRFRRLPLAGYGNRKGRPATGTHDDLEIKAMALRVGDQLGVMVSADLLIMPREVTEAVTVQLEQDLHLRRDQIYLSATHSHSSLGGWGQGWVAEAFAGPFQPGVRAWIAGRVVRAVKAAVEDIKPSSFGQGTLAVPEHVRNRLVGPLGRTNSDLSYMVVRQSNGHLAVLGSYGAHATVLPSSVMEFSADYPGAWQRAIEEATGGMALFLAGTVGSHGPVASASGYAGVEQLGRALASRLLEVLPRTPLTNRVTFATLGLQVALPELHARVTDRLRLRPWLARRLLPVGDGTFLQAFRMDDWVWISTPCDFSGEIALSLQESLRPKGIEPVITSFNGDYIGYVVSSRYYHLPGYEPRLMSFFGPNVPDYLADLIGQLALVVHSLEPSPAGPLTDKAPSADRRPVETPLLLD